MHTLTLCTNRNCNLKPLPRSFYLQPTLQVAQKLIGKYFIHRINKNLLIGKITEVEAYLRKDPASHSFHGKTDRNSVMFREGGHLYVYFTYGMHFCANIVTGKEGIGEAVLIRAVEPLIGIDVMTKNRFPNLYAKGRLRSKACHRKSGFGISATSATERVYTSGVQSLNHQSLINLTNGPAKFCEAFSITKRQNGLDLTDSNIIIVDGESISSRSIQRSARIGIHIGLEKKWRFFIKGNSWVSK